MDTYYRNLRGRVVTNMPWRVVDYWLLTERFDVDDYVTTTAAPLDARDAPGVR
jgi:4-hydroxyacetophenone monooxygenase